MTMKLRRRRTRQYTRNFGREIINSNIPKDSIFRNAFLWKRIARLGSHFCVTWPDRLFGEVQIKWYDFVQWLFYTALYIYCAYYNIVTDLSLLQSTSLIIKYGARSLIIIDLLCGAVFSCVDLLGGQLLWSVLLNLHSFDEKVKMMGHPIDHRNSNRFVNVYIVIAAIMVFIFVAVFFMRYDNASKTKDVIVFILTYFLYFSSYISIMNTYFYVLMGCFIRFGKINSILRSSFGLKGDKQNIRIVTMSHPSSKSLVTDLSVLHDSVLDTIELINRYLSIQSMICTGMTIAYVNVSAFTFYTGYKKFRDKLVSLIYVCWSCVILTPFVILLVIAGSITYNEGVSTANIVHSILNNNSNSPYFEEKLELFSQQLSHRSPIASCGLFVFDWTLLFSIVGASTSYMIILIQFDNTPQNNFILNNSTSHNSTNCSVGNF